MATTRTSVSTGKAKGRRLQQQVRDKVLKTYPSLEPDDCKSTAMGQGGEDVQLSPAARKLFPYSIECKSRKTLSLYDWYDQAKNNSNNSEPLLIVKKDYSKPLVVIDMEHFFNLMERLK